MVLVRQFFPLIHDFRLAAANNGGIDLVNSAGLPDPHAYWRKMKTFDDPASHWDALSADEPGAQILRLSRVIIRLRWLSQFHYKRAKQHS